MNNNGNIENMSFTSTELDVNYYIISTKTKRKFINIYTGFFNIYRIVLIWIILNTMRIN